MSLLKPIGLVAAPKRLLAAIRPNVTWMRIMVIVSGYGIRPEKLTFAFQIFPQGRLSVIKNGITFLK